MKNRRKTGEARKGLRDRIRAHIAICRFDHWIKNIFVVPGILVALPFVRHSDIGVLIAKTILGLLAIGLITSSNYVINELLDAPYDRNHPRKYLRPVAAGRIIIPIAYGQWLLLMLAGLALGQLISLPFAVILLVLWIMGCLYNIPPLRAKDVPYLDVLSESVNNPLRMLAGWYIVDPGMFPSTNLLLSYWMLGAYLMSLKRFAELRDIGDAGIAAAYRKSFGFYTENRLLVATMFYAAASMLFLGAFIMRYKIELIFSFPFIAWVMALYMQLAFEKDSAVQAPEKLYREPLLMVAVLVCSAVMIGLFFSELPSIGDFFTPTLPIANDR